MCETQNTERQSHQATFAPVLVGDEDTLVPVLKTIEPEAVYLRRRDLCELKRLETRSGLGKEAGFHGLF